MVVLDLLINIFFSLIDLIKLTLFFGIPLFVLTAIGAMVFEKVKQKYSLDWLKAAFASTYLIIFILSFVVFFGLYLLISSGINLGTAPPSIADSFFVVVINLLAFFVFNLIKLLIKSLVFAIMAMPFVFIGSFALEFIEKKFETLNKWIRLFGAVLFSSMLWVLLVVFVDWILAGLISFFMIW